MHKCAHELGANVGRKKARARSACMQSNCVGGAQACIVPEKGCAAHKMLLLLLLQNAGMCSKVAKCRHVL